MYVQQRQTTVDVCHKISNEESGKYKCLSHRLEAVEENLRVSTNQHERGTTTITAYTQIETSIYSSSVAKPTMVYLPEGKISSRDSTKELQTLANRKKRKLFKLA
jgi:hypothetical protein